MRDEFEKLAAAGKINRNHIEPLTTLATCGYCMHRSWGFGRIKSVDTVFARFTIDFHSRAGHTMDLNFAAESLKAIDTNHILARKASDLEGLRKMAAVNHLDVIKLVLQSYGGKATVDQIQQLLVPDVIPDDWRKWWETARRELKKDGHFVVPAKKSDPIAYQESEVSMQDRLMDVFHQAKGLKAKVNAAGEIFKSLDDLTDKSAAASEIIAALNVDIASHQRTQPWNALEAIFMRDDLRAATGLAAAEAEIISKQIWDGDTRLAPVLEQVAAAKHKRVLQSFKEANSALWDEHLLAAVNFLPNKMVGECAQQLIHEGRFEKLKKALAKLISHHTASTELLLWLAKERSDAFADIFGPEVFRAMLTAMEREQFANDKKSNRLGDYLLEDHELIVELLEAADLDVIKDATRALQFSPVFEDMDKRSLLARIVKHHPSVQSLISGEQQTKQDHSLIVSWESLERRKSEYDELVHKKIPANSKEIAIARSYGDLSENHEYKAAKEMQKVLMRRKTELESQLSRARGTDFANVNTEAVSIGTRVEVTNLANNHPEHFRILGAWDSDPTAGVISYLSPVAQALMGHKPGDEVELEFEGTRQHFRINAIAVSAPAPAAPAAPAS